MTRRYTTNPEVGKQYEYREDGMRSIVTVLSTNQTETYRSFQVRVDEEIKGDWPSVFSYGYDTVTPYFAGVFVEMGR